MKNIVFVNAHWNNRGDEAALRAVVDSILEVYRDVSITILFKEREEILQFPYQGKVTYLSSKFLPKRFSYYLALYSKGRLGCDAEMRKTVQALEKADLVVYAPGGAVISDRFWWRKQLEYLFPLAFAERKKIPVITAAPSMGPFYKRRTYRNRVLKKIESICVREKISQNYLSSQGITENVSATIDSAFLNDIDRESNFQKLCRDASLMEFLGKYPRVIGITITDLKWHVEYGKTDIESRIKNTFISFINCLAKEGTGVLFIPQLFGKQNDREYLKSFEAANTFLLSEEYDSFFQQYIISRLYGVVGMRYHSNIFAAKMGIPFIPVSYEEKMDGFVEEAKWQRFAVRVEELSAEALLERYQLLKQERERLAGKLTEKSGEWKEKAAETKKLLYRGIDNG